MGREVGWARWTLGSAELGRVCLSGEPVAPATVPAWHEAFGLGALEDGGPQMPAAEALQELDSQSKAPHGS